MSAVKRKVIFAAGLALAAVCVGWPFIQALSNRTIRFVGGQHFLGGGPIHERSHENLPSVAVEAERTLCCRMSYCDFRFPLPPGTRVASIDPLAGGFDTIKGAIYVTNTDGGTVDLRAYARVMRRDGFNVAGDAGFGFTASSPDGGFVAAQDSDHTCKIVFSFFGDY